MASWWKDSLSETSLAGGLLAWFARLGAGRKGGAGPGATWRGCPRALREPTPVASARSGNGKGGGGKL